MFTLSAFHRIAIILCLCCLTKASVAEDTSAPTAPLEKKEDVDPSTDDKPASTDKRQTRLLILNKNTLKRYEVTVPIKKTFEKERLVIRVNSCFTQKLNKNQKGVWAFLEVWAKHPKSLAGDDVSSELIYSAWINNVESYFYDPEYEIQVIGCDGEKAPTSKEAEKESPQSP